MADRDKEKYYWLKLKSDFFKRHDTKIIEGLPNGKDYIIFYLKLLCESTSHEGSLRFSEEIPYNEQMLSTITDTNIDIVRSAVKLFIELKMMEIQDDGTYYMSRVKKMLGKETGKAERMRIYRQSKKEEKNSLLLQNATSLPQCSLEIEIDKEIDKEIENKPSAHTQAYAYIEEILQRTLAPLEMTLIDGWILKFNLDAISEAIKIALSKKVKTPLNYANSILQAKLNGQTYQQQVVVKENKSTGSAWADDFIERQKKATENKSTGSAWLEEFQKRHPSN